MKYRNVVGLAVIGALALGAAAAGASDNLVGISNGASAAVDEETLAHDRWHALMAQNPVSESGCFHASYPESLWTKMDCKALAPRVRPVHVKPAIGEPQVVGNGNDWVAAAQGLISSATGTFKTGDVMSETSVGVDLFGDGGILGANEYTLQLNTNLDQTTAACAGGASGCTVWQQFVYSTDYSVEGEAAVFMQYWLIGWGASACPSSWWQSGTDCYRNSYAATAPDLPITELANMKVGVGVLAGGLDVFAFYHGADVYTVAAFDNVVDIASVWKQAEFNVVGDAGGSEAVFNRGSLVAVTLSLIDGSNSAPSCVANQGTTGETNNFNLGTCTASYQGAPVIQFSESLPLKDSPPVIRIPIRH